MKENKNNQPIDELFARRLGNASLTPNPDGFERLQARMSKVETETRPVLWRTPTMQQYMAIAASLLLVCLFGWLYVHNDKSSLPDGKRVANANSKIHQPDAQGTDAIKESPVTGETVGRTAVASNVTKTQSNGINKGGSGSQVGITTDQSVKKLGQHLPVNVNSEQAVVAQTLTNDIKGKTSEAELTNAGVPKPENTERLSENTNKAVLSAERVLTVTIEEPAAIAEARLALKEKNRVAVNEEKNDKEPKGNLWQQVRRIKEGEVFARHDNANSDDRGLLGRAYNGLKQSFEKDKTEKQ